MVKAAPRYIMIYAELKLADRLTPGRTPWPLLLKRAKKIAARED